MTAPLDRAPVTDLPANNKGRDRTHWLYLAVIFAVIAGVIVGLTAPSTGKSLTVLGTVFVNLIKMMIAPVISARSCSGSARCAKPRPWARSAGWLWPTF
ncbi:C4-dicarboxylate-transporter [Mycobacterium tuberculosis]|nr:C4-dicarboxylate-transporter [Mycobacterium tuberculosis]CKM53279.1 C4-dicarboxylate-transporter [Mycobacterium tuberculosis]CKP82228.1 C4-dicarboxylate-transporter [Mycobacterium tuberculosis]